MLFQIDCLMVCYALICALNLILDSFCNKAVWFVLLMYCLLSTPDLLFFDADPILYIVFSYVAQTIIFIVCAFMVCNQYIFSRLIYCILAILSLLNMFVFIYPTLNHTTNEIFYLFYIIKDRWYLDIALSIPIKNETKTIKNISIGATTVLLIASYLI